MSQLRISWKVFTRHCCLESPSSRDLPPVTCLSIIPTPSCNLTLFSQIFYHMVLYWLWFFLVVMVLVRAHSTDSSWSRQELESAILHRDQVAWLEESRSFCQTCISQRPAKAKLLESRAKIPRPTRGEPLCCRKAIRTRCPLRIYSSYPPHTLLAEQETLSFHSSKTNQETGKNMQK